MATTRDRDQRPLRGACLRACPSDSRPASRNQNDPVLKTGSGARTVELVSLHSWTGASYKRVGNTVPASERLRHKVGIDPNTVDYFRAIPF